MVKDAGWMIKDLRQTFVIVESLLRLKIGSNGCNITDESICAEVTSIIGY